MIISGVCYRVDDYISKQAIITQCGKTQEGEHRVYMYLACIWGMALQRKKPLI
jgi:hypothetical protein